MKHRLILEVCVASVDDAIAAESGGADRLELNLALELGGLTPSLALFLEVRSAVRLPIMVMIRPRAAGFRYSIPEQRLMFRDAENFLGHGADGVVSGALLADLDLDRKFWKELVDLVGTRQIVFHRAFDAARSPDQMLRELIDLGTTRVLTSGGSQTALEGAGHIAALRIRAEKRIQLLPGSGINAENVRQVVELTGCDQVHGSFGQFRTDQAGSLGQHLYPTTSRETVAAVRHVLDGLNDERWRN